VTALSDLVAELEATVECVTAATVPLAELDEAVANLLAAVADHERHRRGQGHQPRAYDLALWRLAAQLAEEPPCPPT